MFHWNRCVWHSIETCIPSLEWLVPTVIKLHVWSGQGNPATAATTVDESNPHMLPFQATQKVNNLKKFINNWEWCFKKNMCTVYFNTIILMFLTFFRYIILAISLSIKISDDLSTIYLKHDQWYKLSNDIQIFEYTIKQGK